jgi:hypothetical protein
MVKRIDRGDKPKGKDGRGGARPDAGKPTYYKPEFCEIAKKFCMLGAVDIELADLFGVDPRVLYNWRHRFPEFAAACKVGKGYYDDRVEQALAHRAIGYTHDEEKVTVAFEKGYYKREPVLGKNGKPVLDRNKKPVTKRVYVEPQFHEHRTKTRKHYPPETGAATMWLVRRKPKEWSSEADNTKDPATKGIDALAEIERRLDRYFAQGTAKSLAQKLN